MKLIKSVFNIYNKFLEKRLRTKRLLLRFRRLSSNRIYLSNGEFKHTNNKVLINIYIFNRQIHNYISKIKSIYLKKILSKKNFNKNILKTLISVKKKSLNSIKLINKDKYSLIQIFNFLENNKKYKIENFKSLSNHTNNFYTKIINLTMKKIRLYFIYKQLIFMNRSKLNYNFLHLLKNHLENVFNKNVEFNLINLNRFYLNSDILFESIKLKLTRNKRKMRKFLNKIKDKVKITEKKNILNNISDNKPNNEIKKVDDINNINNLILSNIKYKRVSGFRLEARGRLSRRYTASRSVSKVKYKGNLLNLYSSYKGISSVILRGNLESNLQYTKLSSKTRIGLFGIKGWVSGN